MNKEFEFFHGVVLARILHGSQRQFNISSFNAVSNSSYIINGDIGLYIKYCSKRMTPWKFTFKADHQAEIETMRLTLKRVYLILVCNEDGIVCLTHSELKCILDENYEPVEWISVERHRRELYSVRGSNGKLDFKISKSEFPLKIFNDPKAPESNDSGDALAQRIVIEIKPPLENEDNEQL